MLDWSYFDKFEPVDNKYLPDRGEGNTMANQIVTATAKLVYKWYNDGDTPDNTHFLTGWWNDLSSYANWIYKYVPKARNILDNFFTCHNGDEYTRNFLQPLVDLTNTFEFLVNYETKYKVGTIYDCDGPFIWKDYEDEEDEEDWI